MIATALTRISSNYLDAKMGSMKDSSLAPFINKVSKEIIKPKIKKNKEHFKYRSSCGQHSNWAEAPIHRCRDGQHTARNTQIMDM